MFLQKLQIFDKLEMARNILLIPWIFFQALNKFWKSVNGTWYFWQNDVIKNWIRKNLRGFFKISDLFWHDLLHVQGYLESKRVAHASGYLSKHTVIHPIAVYSMVGTMYYKQSKQSKQTVLIWKCFKCVFLLLSMEGFALLFQAFILKILSLHRIKF